MTLITFSYILNNIPTSVLSGAGVASRKQVFSIGIMMAVPAFKHKTMESYGVIRNFCTRRLSGQLQALVVLPLRKVLPVSTGEEAEWINDREFHRRGSDGIWGSPSVDAKVFRGTGVDYIHTQTHIWTTCHEKQTLLTSVLLNDAGSTTQII
jgi:hypothetical protein